VGEEEELGGWVVMGRLVDLAAVKGGHWRRARRRAGAGWGIESFGLANARVQ